MSIAFKPTIPDRFINMSVQAPNFVLSSAQTTASANLPSDAPHFLLPVENQVAGADFTLQRGRGSTSTVRLWNPSLHSTHIYIDIDIDI